jgi:hypothetical protein
MTNDLSALPQPVREAVELFDIDAEKGTRYTRHDDWQIIRAELLQLANERWAVVATRNAAIQRAERAESELAALRKRVAGTVAEIDSALNGERPA